MSLKTKTRVMKYIETVNHDKMIGYEILWWSVSITLPILLAVVSAVLAGLNFKDWNPLAPKFVIVLIFLIKWHLCLDLCKGLVINTCSSLSMPWREVNLTNQLHNGILTGSSQNQVQQSNN